MIVVGVDGSAAGMEAARWAAGEAALRGVPLHLVYAMPAWACEPQDGPYAEVAKWMRDGADSVLKDALEQVRSVRPEITVTSARAPGDARPALMAAAEDAELLVVGNHGLGGFRGLLLGSVALGVSGHARCPVAVVRTRAATPRREIVLGIDGARSGEETVRLAFAEAALRGADLVAVHAGAAQAGPEQEHRLPAEALERYKAQYPGVKVIEREIAGHPVNVLLEASSGAEMLFVGSRGRGGFTGLVLGSVSHALLHHADCPVVIVPPGFEIGSPPSPR